MPVFKDAVSAVLPAAESATAAAVPAAEAVAPAAMSAAEYAAATAPTVASSVGSAAAGAGSFLGELFDNAVNYAKDNPVKTLGTAAMLGGLMMPAPEIKVPSIPPLAMPNLPAAGNLPNDELVKQQAQVSAQAPPPGTQVSPIFGRAPRVTPPSQGLPLAQRLEDEINKQRGGFSVAV